MGHRFGWTPVLTGGGLLWSLIAGLACAAWVRRRKQARAKLAEWAREEAAMALAASTPSGVTEVHTLPVEDAMPPRFSTSIPVVEHEGHWYTLH